MPVDLKTCVIDSLFSIKLSQRFNTLAVNKIFKYVLFSSCCAVVVVVLVIDLTCVVST